MLDPQKKLYHLKISGDITLSAFRGGISLVLDEQAARRLQELCEDRDDTGIDKLFAENIERPQIIESSDLVFTGDDTYAEILAQLDKQT